MAEETKTTELVEEVKEETTEVTPVEEPEVEKVGFFKKVGNGIKKFGNSKPGKVLKVVGLVGVGALGALGLSKVSSKESGEPDLVIDLDDSDVKIEEF